MVRYLIAMEREAERFVDAMGYDPGVEIIGIGAREAGWYSKDDVLVNLGYAGGYKIKVGTLIEPSFAMDIHTGDLARINPIFPLESRICLTSDVFVEAPLYGWPTLYDMELFTLATIPHKQIYSIKIVSDNLCEKACEAFDGDYAWKKVAELVKEFIVGEEN